MQITWVDASQRQEVKLFYRQHMPYARLLQKESIGVLTHKHQIIASARIRPIGQLQILTGMLVHPDYRGQGIAHQLMQQLKPTISHGNTYLFALPHLAAFYVQHGFSAINCAPNDIEQLFKKYQTKDKPLVLMGLPCLS
ncbi:GNAT family N-acetyltransferase [Shewanella youngdeokensis]|uniref:GNAT family N-acetyltransferase n=1 Tax=Shewanella youngdeokensis TaxID=2999068 RepID=A0ABZ0JZI7_9GAMM|nr:GNAT family N-acetyltransferase [Shewanella sp. DAU334]